mmetsp:Transcript_5565/g.13733  ORF Transcript_5565/g.13733 Transcript_5565/m.13733 type:complete len:236 (+) Transcript_5565:1057-1764(+)
MRCSWQEQSMPLQTRFAMTERLRQKPPRGQKNQRRQMSRQLLKRRQSVLLGTPRVPRRAIWNHCNRRHNTRLQMTLTDLKRESQTPARTSQARLTQRTKRRANVLSRTRWRCRRPQSFRKMTRKARKEKGKAHQAIPRRSTGSPSSTSTGSTTRVRSTMSTSCSRNMLLSRMFSTRQFVESTKSNRTRTCWQPQVAPHLPLQHPRQHRPHPRLQLWRHPLRLVQPPRSRLGEGAS